MIDNLDLFEMHEREEDRRIRRMTRLELEEELGFSTVDEEDRDNDEEEWEGYTE